MPEVTEQIVREAPDIEAYKVGLLQSAKALADKGITLPSQQVAGMSGLQTSAIDLAKKGIGAYQPYLTEAGYTLGDAQKVLGNVMGAATPYQTAAQAAMQGALGQVPKEVSAAQQALQAATTYGAGQTGTAQQQLGTATGASRQIAAQSMADQLKAIQGARGVTGQAATALQQAGALGTGSALQGIAGLAGTTGQYSPSAAASYMNPYETAAVNQAIADIARAGQIQQQQLGAQAVGAGAFGGSRQAIAQQELNRNVLEQQGRTAAQMRQAGYSQAAQQAQQAYEAQQARAQQAAQLTGSLGAQGASAGMQAAQAAGQLGLSAEQLAAQTAAQAGQTGLSAEQLAAQAARDYGTLGQSQAQLAGQLAGQAGTLGMQGAQTAADIGQGLGALGAQYGQLGLQTGEALGTTGLRQASLGELVQAAGQKEQGFLFDLGKTQQAQQQAELDAKRASELQQLYEPYQRIGFLSDIYKGAPTSQMSITGTTAPQPSTAQSILGLGISGLSAAAGAQKAGLFG